MVYATELQGKTSCYFVHCAAT